MESVVIIFTLDTEGYYIEAVETRDIEKVKEYWDVKMVIDEVSSWRNYEKTRDELKNPTIPFSSQLAVIHSLNEHVNND